MAKHTGSDTLIIWAIGGMLIATAGAFHLGKSAGATQYELAEQIYRKEIEHLTAINKRAEAEHKAKVENLNDVIEANEQTYRDALERAKSEHASRMRKSEDRAKAYVDMSQAGAAERARLADHAAELDRTVEEGRLLVRELRETVGQRDREVKALATLVLELHSLGNSTGNK